MTVTIKVDIQVIITANGEFGNQNNTLWQLIEQMKNLVNSLFSFWQGEAADAYKNKFAQLDDDMDYLNRRIKEHTQDLADIAAEYQQADTDVTAIIDGLATDIIK